MNLGHAYTVRVESLRDLIKIYDREVTMLERHIRGHLAGHQGIRRCRPSTESARRSRR